MAEEPVGQEAIHRLVADARVRYEFRRSTGDRALIRRGPPDDSDSKQVFRLVTGRWIRQRRLDFDDLDTWEEIEDKELRWHVRRYLIRTLDAPAMSWEWGELRARFGRGALGRWWNPPLRGGATSVVKPGLADRSRLAYKQRLEATAGDELTAIVEQARMGLDSQRERSAGVEQRANFFLGAAGLTTSLVLANAGLLLGDSKLESPWIYLAVAALAIASGCAVLAGFRALQAAMYTFVRTPAYETKRILERRNLDLDEARRREVGALLVAQARTKTIADWKVARLKEARRWFLRTTIGIVVLTLLVLASVVENA